MKDYSYLKPLTNNPDAWAALVRFAEEELKEIHIYLEGEKEFSSLKFFQGRAMQLRALLKLRDHSNAEKRR
jgi:hypothetical protein